MQMRRHIGRSAGISAVSSTAVVLLIATWVAASNLLVIDRFSSDPGPGGVPAGWKVLKFPGINRHTRYSVTGDGDNKFVKAVSDRSASAIYKEVDLDPKNYPLLSWRWKIEDVLEKGDGRTKGGDDYAARVYVTFHPAPDGDNLFERMRRKLAQRLFGVTPPDRALNYIWANRLKKGVAIPNAYTDRAVMVAVESGRDEAGRWVEEEVNIYRDYRRLFKGEPPRLSGVAIMTDSDNTGEAATAYYDDIVFKRDEGAPQAPSSL